VLKQKKKLQKKQLKEDKLVTTFTQVQEFYEDNQKIILGVVGAVAALILILFFYINKLENENLTATAELSRVLPAYENGGYQEAIDGKPGTNIIGLKSIVDLYSGTNQGELARIYLANAYFFLGQIAEAQKEFEDYSGSSLELKASAKAGVASCQESMSAFGDAASNYEKAADYNEFNPLNAEYLLFAGINYINSDQAEKAKEVLTKLKKDYSSSVAGREADRYLAITE